MKHYGDIKQINGSDVPPVNVIIGGSPCQDLSVAGKRAGLSGERSGLFMEQIRIIKEMRKSDEQNGRSSIDARPRYMVWENVPGAFSSNKGQDFKAVLEETVGIVAKNKPDIPIPKGGWHYSGIIMGDGFSVAWRVFDAQFWGVPQRRRRIALVADFGGCTAPEILFERKSVRGYTPPSETPWKDFAAAVAERFGNADQSGRNNTRGAVVFNGENITSKANRANPKINDPCHTLNATGANRCYCIQGNCIDRADTAGCNGRGWREDKSYTLNTVDRPAVYDARGNGDGQIAPTMTDDHQSRITDYTGLVCGFPLGFRPENTKVYNEKATTVCNGTRAGFCNGIIALDRAAFNQGENAQYDFEVSENGVNSTLTAKGPSAICESTVRRLTPLECERLQGFPDGWTDIGDYIDTNGKKRKTSDTARYKALGNSIALPSWVWVLERLPSYCGDKPTMASLFDGIGGFPLIWETLNGAGTCLWASEIEEFPIAVTKLRFGED